MFIGKSTPVYDISKHYGPDAIRDVLVRDIDLGTSLASCFAHSHSSSSPTHRNPDEAVVLMRGHGYTVVGSSIEECIFRAIYTKENAMIQTAALGLRLANHGKDTPDGDIEYLRDDEIAGTAAISRTAWSRAWGLWLREVEASQLYVLGS